MAREKNTTWTIERSLDGNYSYDSAQLAVLMDIRDELQMLNRLLGCSNAIAIPNLLRDIAANTKKRRRK